MRLCKFQRTRNELKTELAQQRANDIGPLLAVKETLAQDQREQTQFREQIAVRVEKMAGEIRQSQTLPDFSSL